MTAAKLIGLADMIIRLDSSEGLSPDALAAMQRLASAAVDSPQLPAAYVRADVFEKLKSPVVAGVSASINKQPIDGSVGIYLAPPASSNLLTAARHYASSYLQQERDDPKLCCDAKHHEDVCALFAAIEGEGEDVAAKRVSEVGCDRDDGLLNIHAESETCEVCATSPSAIAATKEGA